MNRFRHEALLESPIDCLRRAVLGTGQWDDAISNDTVNKPVDVDTLVGVLAIYVLRTQGRPLDVL